MCIKKHSSTLYYYSIITSFYHIWSRERAKYETVKQGGLLPDWLIICLCPGFFDTRTSEITNKMAAEDVLFHCLLQDFFIATASCTPFFFLD